MARLHRGRPVRAGGGDPAAGRDAGADARALEHPVQGLARRLALGAAAWPGRADLVHRHLVPVLRLQLLLDDLAPALLPPRLRRRGAAACAAEPGGVLARHPRWLRGYARSCHPEGTIGTTCRTVRQRPEPATWQSTSLPSASARATTSTCSARATT